MLTTHDNRTPSLRLFGGLLLALVSIGVTAGAVSSSAALPAGVTPVASVQIPAGDECWTEISTQNVLTGGNYLVGMDGDPETGTIMAAGYYTTDLSLQSEGVEGIEGGFGGQTQLVEFYTGSSFQMVPNPPGLGDYGRLNGVGAIPGTNNEFWLVGNVTSSTVTTTFTLNLIERFNGSSLSIVPNPQPAGVGQRLTDVDAASPTFAIAVGRVQSFSSGLLPVISRWNGTSWVAETPPSVGNAELYGVTTFPDGRAVAVGIDYDPDVRHVIMTRDVGGTWSAPSLTLPGSGSRLTGVDAISPTDIWAVGYKDTLDGRRPYSVHGNLTANTWDNIDMPVTPSGDNSSMVGVGDFLADAVSCTLGGLCYAVGSFDTGTNFTGVTWKKDDAGSSWLRLPNDGLYGFFAYFAGAFGFINSDRPDGSVTGMYGALNYSQVGGLNRTTVLRYEDSCGGPQPSPTPGGPTATPGPPTATPTPCTPGQFSDVPPEHTFYPFITCLVNNEVISGYADCTFRPGNNITRGQLSKVVSNAAGFTDPVSGQTFEDIPVGSTFYDFVERLASRGIIGGYACGGPGEPCVPPGNRPYFRPNANSTRGQITKIVAVAANFQDPTTNQTFEDVPVGSTFYLWIENLASRGIMSGYACGGVGEPCVPPGNRAYFRPSNSATRGQTSKIVANTFFPSCNPVR